MRRWYKLGFLNDRLELFVHRGDVADPYTLGELFELNGRHSPFSFAKPSLNATPSSGFLCRPPGLETEKSAPTHLSYALSDVTSISVYKSQTPSTAKKQSQKLDFTCTSTVSRMPSNCAVAQKKSTSIAPVGIRISAAEVLNQAKSMPLLSQPTTRLPNAITRLHLKERVELLESLMTTTNMKEFDSDVRNNDLREAVCKLCRERFLCASDVLKHLVEADHLYKVEGLRQLAYIDGSEFDDYCARLVRQVRKSKGGNSKPTSASRSAQPPSKAATATNPPFAAGTQLSSSNQPSNQSTSTATPNVVKSKLSTTTQLPNGPAVAITSGTQSSAENKHAQTSPALKPSSNVKVVYSQAYLKARTSPTTAVEGASKENGLDAGDSTTLLLQKATEVSDELTGKDLDTEMEKLRDLAKRIDSQKFCDMYRNRMESKSCSHCKVKLDSPTTKIAHCFSRYHCKKLQQVGVKITRADIELWRSQILAGS
ncbi:hypothetical protein Q1695_005000 [Nippostrongylus brasiliensis]|nr:hypothetical protein Q1695_005000 [Nippostrongylus brasiliensis]